MQVLILSCDTGEGHNAAAKAIENALIKRNHEVTLINIFKLHSDTTAHLIGDTYVKIVSKNPNFFKLLYQLGTNVDSLPGNSPIYYVNSLMARDLENYLNKHHFDCIVTPHLYAAETLTYLKRKGKLNILTIGVATDYTCIPFFGETDLDYCVIPDESLINEFTEKGINPEKIKPYGIPVDNEYRNKIDTKQAKQNLGLPDQKCCLIMGGSMGYGHIEDLVNQLLNRPEMIQLVVITGKNEILYQKLKEEFKDKNNVKVLGFTDKVNEYMDASDVIFTKPGGLTSTEALVKNKPLVFTDPIPGCETFNRNFFTKRKIAYSADSTIDQATLGLYLLTDEEKREQLLDNQQKYAKPDAADKISTLVEQVGKGNR